MSVRGKDGRETRYKVRLWWHQNRDWVGLLAWVGAVVLILTFLN